MSDTVRYLKRLQAEQALFPQEAGDDLVLSLDEEENGADDDKEVRAVLAMPPFPFPRESTRDDDALTPTGTLAVPAWPNNGEELVVLVALCIMVVAKEWWCARSF